MTTYTAGLALPKPEGTDLISQGYDAIDDLADAIEARLRPYSVIKATAQTVTNSAVLVNDTELFLDLAAGNVYELVAHLAVSGNGTNDFRCAWAVTGGITVVGARGGRGMATAATDRTNGASTLADALTLTTHASYGTDTTGAIGWVREEMLVRVPAAGPGRVTLQWAQLTATAGAATTVWNSSYLRAIPVAKV